MKKLLLASILCWLFPGICFANGGGFAFGVKLTGTVTPFVPKGTQRVRILDEKLDILLTPSGAQVSVQYLLENTTKERAPVTFGFPVEGVKEPYEDAPTSATRRKRLKESFRDYSVEVDGTPLKASYQEERYGEDGGGVPSIVKMLRRIKGWMVSSTSFEPGQRRQMLIRYKADYDVRGETISFDEINEASVFRYRLSTGAVWQGTIAAGRVTIRALGIHLPWVKIKRPVNRFRKEGDAWIWSFSDLEPTLADDIEIHAVPKTFKYSSYAYEDDEDLLYYTWNEKEFYLPHTEYRIKSSSVSGKRFWARNVKSYSGRAWCEGVEGAGTGESLEIVPYKKLPLLGLFIGPGFIDSDRPYLFNRFNRPAEVEIVLNDEHRFAARLADEPEPHLIVVEGYSKPVTKVKIILKEVYKGSKWDDTCLAQVTLVSRLRSRPKHVGAR